MVNLYFHYLEDSCLNAYHCNFIVLKTIIWFGGENLQNVCSSFKLDVILLENTYSNEWENRHASNLVLGNQIRSLRL